MARGVLLGLWISGCSAGVQIQSFSNNGADNFSSSHHQLDVPFFSDNTDQCGPSVLASVFTFWNRPTEPADLREEIYFSHLKGTLTIDLLVAAQNRGFDASLTSGSLIDLKSELRKGRPVIAFINRGYDFFPLGHYVVVNGYDETLQGLYIHSGSSQNQFVRYKHFLKSWNKTQRSTLLIWPSTVEEGDPHAKAKL